MVTKRPLLGPQNLKIQLSFVIFLSFNNKNTNIAKTLFIAFQQS